MNGFMEISIVSYGNRLTMYREHFLSILSVISLRYAQNINIQMALQLLRGLLTGISCNDEREELRY